MQIHKLITTDHGPSEAEQKTVACVLKHHQNLKKIIKRFHIQFSFSHFVQQKYNESVVTRRILLALYTKKCVCGGPCRDSALQFLSIVSPFDFPSLCPAKGEEKGKENRGKSKGRKE